MILSKLLQLLPNYNNFPKLLIIMQHIKSLLITTNSLPNPAKYELPYLSSKILNDNNDPTHPI